MPAEITIRFEGDAAVLNSLSNPQPVPALKSQEQLWGGLANAVDQVEKISQSVQAAVGIQGQTTAQATRQILTQGGQQAAVRAAATGAAATDGAIGIGAAIAAVKTSADLVDAESARPRGASSQVAIAQDVFERNRDLRMMKRGDELGPDLAKWIGQQNKPDGNATEILTKILSTMLTAFEGTRPFAEFVHDQLASINARVTELAMAATIVKSKFELKYPNTRPEELNQITAMGSALAKEIEARSKEQVGEGDSLDAQSKDLAKDLVESFVVGSGPKIPPSR